jgi:ABC-type lipoprotein export system ATPase subunit
LGSLKINNISKTFTIKHINVETLRNIDFEIENGEFVLLVHLVVAKQRY